MYCYFTIILLLFATIDAVLTQAVCRFFRRPDGCNSRASFGADASRGQPRSRSEQCEVQRLELLRQGSFHGPPQYPAELESHCRNPQGESTRKREPSFGVSAGLAKQGANFVASANFRRCLHPGLEDGAGQQLEGLRDRSLHKRRCSKEVQRLARGRIHVKVEGEISRPPRPRRKK